MALPMLPEEKDGMFCSAHRLWMVGMVDWATYYMHLMAPSRHRCRIGKIALKHAA